MRIKNFYSQIIISLVLFLAFFASSSLAAVNPPDFPSCVNPQGTVVASYSSGTHGVPGDATAYQGSDSVYKLTNGNLTQCLCTENGDGIQTIWWKTSSLTLQEIESLKTQGWVFIPDGSAWGLDPTTYLAKNSRYACRGVGGGDVLGLAGTGNIRVIYGLFFTGFLSLMMGYLLNKRGY